MWLGLALLAALALLWRFDLLPIESTRRRLLASWERATMLVELPQVESLPPLTPDSLAFAVPATMLPTDRPTTAASPSPAASVTIAPSPSEATELTATPTDVATAMPDTAGTYRVARGDSLMIIGEKVGLPWDAIARLNGLTANSVLQMGQLLQLPTVTPVPTNATTTPSPTATISPTALATATQRPSATVAATIEAIATPTPSSTPRPAAEATTVSPARTDSITYTLQPGDTLIELGQRFDVAWEAIAAANGNTSATSLRAGTQLLIPPPGSTAPPPATPTRRPTSTPQPPTRTPLPSLAPVALLAPGDNAAFTGTDGIVQLSWAPAAGMPPDARYQVVVGWTANGAAQEHLWATTETATTVPQWLWQRADQPERRYVWTVRIVQPSPAGDVIAILSPSAPTRSFSWN